MSGSMSRERKQVGFEGPNAGELPTENDVAWSLWELPPLSTFDVNGTCNE
jgi:hypothetical protein